MQNNLNENRLYLKIVRGLTCKLSLTALGGLVNKGFGTFKLTKYAKSIIIWTSSDTNLSCFANSQAVTEIKILIFYFLKQAGY